MSVRTEIRNKEHETEGLSHTDSNEDLYRLLVENSTDYAIIMLDPTGHIATGSAAAEKLKGYRPEEIIGKHFSIFYSKEDVGRGKCEHELEVAKRDGRFEDE